MAVIPALMVIRQPVKHAPLLCGWLLFVGYGTSYGFTQTPQLPPGWETDVTTQVIQDLAHAYAYEREEGTAAVGVSSIPYVASLLRQAPLVDKPNAASVLLSLPTVHSLSSDSAHWLRDEGSSTSACSDNPNPLLSYMTATDVSRLSVIVTPVSGTDTATCTNTSDSTFSALNGANSYHRNSAIRSVHDPNPLYNLVPMNLNVTVEQAVNQWKSGAEIRLMTERQSADPLSDAPTAVDYTMVNLHTSYNLYDGLTVRFGVDNVLDQQEDPLLGGISYSIRLHWRPR